MSFVYVDDGSAVPADVRVFEDRHGYFEDKDGRKITKLLEHVGIAPEPKGDFFAEIKAQLDRIEAAVTK